MAWLKSTWKEFVGCCNIIFQTCHHGAGRKKYLGAISLYTVLISNVLNGPNNWYYPFYYAPFASDFRGLSQFKISFTKDKPLRPFEQLMAVLPPESSSAVPKCYKKLIDSEDSEIRKFYPSELKIDTHGKRFLWQGIPKLPFIDEKLLLSATKALEKDLAVHEKKRNTVRQEKIFLRGSNILATNAAVVQSECSAKKLPMGQSTSELGGCLSPDDDDGISRGIFRSPIKDLEDIQNDQTLSFMFFNPEPVKAIPRLLDHVEIPVKTITESDISTRPLWHTYRGAWPPKTIATAMEAPPRRGFGQGRGCIGQRRGGVADTETWHGSSSHGRGYHGPVAAAQTHGRFDNGGGANCIRPAGSALAGRGCAQGQYGSAFQRQQETWRPVGPWPRGGGAGGGRNGGRHGGRGHPRGW